MRFLPFAAFALLAACGGQSNEEALQDAANQSDPAAAAVLENAAENGMDPQNALAAAGQAQIANGVEDQQEPNSTLQARPNLPQSPNRSDGSRPPEKVDVEGQSANAQ
jgi:hypothetical protein